MIASSEKQHQQNTKSIVGYAGGPIISKICDLLPANEYRSSLVDSLITALDLKTRCINITVKPSTNSELSKFHDKAFIKYLMKRRSTTDDEGMNGGELNPQLNHALDILNRLDDVVKDDELSSDEEFSSDSSNDTDDELENKPVINQSFDEKFGLKFDCPVFPYMSSYVRIICGATISCAKFLTRQYKINLEQSNNKGDNIDEKTSTLVAINWNGGRHHAKRAKASGFCYANDIVLGILELRKTFTKVMYIDLDLHHGDGVETAFQFSNKVFTISIHRYDIGFFPGTGSVDDKGIGMGKNFAINIPTRKGFNDENLLTIYEEIILKRFNEFKPDAIVLQCGSDGLSSDEHKEWNLSIKGIGKVVNKIIELGKPTLCLGGGGYNHTETSKCWSYITALLTGYKESNRELFENEWEMIPDHENFDEYKNDGYTFWSAEVSRMKNGNDKDEYLENIIAIINNRY